VYEERPELREAADIPGFWQGVPLGEHQVKRYRKFTKSPALKLKPHVIRAVKSWRRKPLAAHLRRRLRLSKGRSHEATIHLYETMPGTDLQDISRAETGVQGLGPATGPAWMQLHPLTQEAAGMLLGEPALGRDVPARYLDDPSLPPAVGQRFYYLEIAGAQPQAVTTTGGTPTPKQTSEVNLVVDTLHSQIRVSTFVGEAQAQELAAKLRKHASIGIVLTDLKSIYEPGVRAALTGGMHRRTVVLHGALTPEQSHGHALKWLPQLIQEKLEARVIEWLGQSLAKHLQQRAQELVTATEAAVEGVTLKVILNNPPGLPKIRRVLGGEPVVLRSKWFTDEMPDANVQILPGYQRA
jgi:hypothetical protein